MLHDFAGILTRDLRQIDLAARYGGEEFVLLLPETTQDGAMLVAQRVRRAVEQASFRLSADADAPMERLTISIGIAVFPEDARVKSALLEAADAALYEAKARGRNRVVFHSRPHSQKEAS